MRKSLLIVSSLALTTGLLSAGAGAQDKGIQSLTPKSGWSVARFDNDPNNKYCALSRQYDNGLILTLGRNATEEYSLAIDFQAAKLNTEKAYGLTLQPSQGQIRAYEMLPASERAMVVRLGYDDSFFKALESSGVLKAELDGTNYEFSTPDFASGRADLDNCLEGLRGKSPTKVAKGFSAEKVTDAPPIKEVPAQTQEVVVKPPVVEKPKVETKVAEAAAAAPRKPVIIEKVEQKVAEQPIAETKPMPAPTVKVVKEILTEEPVKPEPVKKVAEVSRSQPPAKSIEITRVEPPKTAPVKTEVVEQKKADAPPQKLVSKKTEMAPATIRSNNDALLKRAGISKDPSVSVTPSPPKASVRQTSLQKEQRDALEQLKAENERLGKALQAQVAKPETKAVDRSDEVAALQSQIAKLQSDLTAAKTSTGPIDAKLKADAEKLRLENEQLKLAMKEAQKTPVSKMVSEEPAVDTKLVKQLEDLKAENTRLSAALQGQEKKLASFDASSPEAEKDLAEMRKKLAEMEEENKKLYLDARDARSQIDTAAIETGNQALKKIREYERKLEAAQIDNLALSKEIEGLRRKQEDVRLSEVAGDWDLEKATKRYNEAEREIKRLGMLLEQQRVAHRQERGELEQMLFDPAVTEQEQRRRLTELELQLAAAERELQAAGKRLPERPNIRPTIPRSPVEERVAVSSLTPAPAASVQRENLEIQRLENKVARQNQQLQAYARQQTRAEPSAALPLSPSPAIRPVAERPVSVSARPAPMPEVTPIAAAPVQRFEPALVARQPVAPPPQQQQIVAGGDFDQNQLQQLLRQSGLPLSGSVSQQSPGQYRWSAGRLVGQAQVVPRGQVGSIDQFAQSYIARAKQSCGGDFASLPSESRGAGTTYEIACISPTRSTSSSVVFTQKGNDLIAIAHESSADDMDSAMDARDRVAASL